MPALLSQPNCSLREALVPVFEAFVAEAERLSGNPGGMGEMEESLGSMAELQRLALERAAQAKADGADNSRCPACGDKLERVTGGHERTVQTRFGEVVLRRSKGWCAKCGEWRFPADDLLGLHRRAAASPAVQEASALLVSKMPAEEAAKVLGRLMGRPADDSTMAREARRAGERAKKLRGKMDEEACHTEGRWRVTEEVRRGLGPAPFVLVIEMDAWLVRERDEWGRTQQLQDAGEKFSRWHWVYTATVFRLDARAQTQSGRPVILSRAADPAHKEALEREAAYFETHKDHMDYEDGASKGEPIGSGAIESTCRQHQCRFKRPGMFWTTEGDDALLALECFWRNGRWSLLFPHSAGNAPARN